MVYNIENEASFQNYQINRKFPRLFQLEMARSDSKTSHKTKNHS